MVKEAPTLRSSTRRPPHVVRALARYWRLPLLCAWLPAAYLVTLSPLPSITRPGPEPFDPCLLCGFRGTADAILNVVFFVPLGLVAVRRLSLMRTTALGLALSLGIEMAQLTIAGRYSTLADIVWNTTGALAGGWLHGRLALIARGTRPPAVTGLLLALAVGASAFIGGWLLEPSPTNDAYWGQRTPSFGPGTRYTGTVLEARFNEHPFPTDRLPDSWSSPAMLLEDWELSGSVVKGRPPDRFTSILSIYDGHQREVLYFGAYRERLFLRERLRAQDFLLDQPELTAFGALEPVSVGDTVRLAARRSGAERCISVDERETCLAFTPGRLWGLLAWGSSRPEWYRRAVDTLWLAGLFFPIGLFARTWRHVLLHGGLAIVFLAAAVGVTRLVPGPRSELLAALAGLVLGLAGAHLLRYLGSPGSSDERSPGPTRG